MDKFGDWRDMPLKNEEQCEYCGKFFQDLNKHRDKVHGKGQKKLDIDDSVIELKTSHMKEEMTKWENELIKDILEILQLKALCRIRGLSIDIENQPNKDYYGGAKNEYQELYRHLEQLKYIIADIDCAEKYLDNDEKSKFKFLKNKLGFKEVEDD